MIVDVSASHGNASPHDFCIRRLSVAQASADRRQGENDACPPLLRRNPSDLGFRHDIVPLVVAFTVSHLRR
jgi:hypothetical protein